MNQIYCSNCGKLIPNTSNFCTYCGAPQHGKEASVFRAQAPTVENPQNLGHMARAVVGGPAQTLQETNLPPRSDEPYMHRQTLGRDAVLYFILIYLTRSFLLFFGLLVGAILLPKIFIIALIAYFIGVVMIALLDHNNFYFEINNDGLTIDKGIIYKYSVSVPFEQVQNVNIERAILDRILGLCRVSIETAGAANNGNVAGTAPKAEAYIPALRLDKAKFIHDLLIDGADGTIDGVYTKQ